MTACFEKNSLFGLPCVSFVNVYQFLYVFFFPFWFSGWDVGFDCIYS